MSSHGRDNALRVWRVNSKDEASLEKISPVDRDVSTTKGQEPWLIHSITVNALNFCGFAIAFRHNLSALSLAEKAPSGENGSAQPSDALRQNIPQASPESFIAVPNALNTGGIDIFHLPSQKRVCLIEADKSSNTGMVMALEMLFSSAGDLYIVSGYEDGRVVVHRQRGPIAPGREINNPATSNWAWCWERLYTNRAHSQPVLSMDLSSGDERYFLTSSADALIVKHPLPIATNDVKSCEEPTPLKILNTKHAGQQGLKLRSDAKIFATAGWDGRARVYACKTLKELAVLKWHKEGCYSIAFARIEQEESSTSTTKQVETITGPGMVKPENTTLLLRDQPRSLAQMKQQRSRKAQLTHWVAVGSKDGKISLWDIY